MLKSRLEEIARQAEREARLAVIRAGREIELEARKRARRRTGAMQAGIRVEPRAGDGLELELRADEDYTRFHEYGSLHVSPQPMLRPAAAAARRPFVERMKRAYR